VNANDATAANYFFACFGLRSQSVKHLHEAQTTVFALFERSVNAWNININRDQHGEEEHNECDCQRSTTAVQWEEDVKQSQNDECCQNR